MSHWTSHPVHTLRDALRNGKEPLPATRCPYPLPAARTRYPLPVPATRCPLPAARCPLPAARCPLPDLRSGECLGAYKLPITTAKFAVINPSHPGIPWG